LSSIPCATNSLACSGVHPVDRISSKISPMQRRRGEAVHHHPDGPRRGDRFPLLVGAGSVGVVAALFAPGR
jgi:hypothetical protein